MHARRRGGPYRRGAARRRSLIAFHSLLVHSRNDHETHGPSFPSFCAFTPRSGIQWHLASLFLSRLPSPGRPPSTSRVPFRYVRTSFHCRDYYRSPFLSIELAVTPTSDVNAAGRSADSRTTPLRSRAPTRTSRRYLAGDAAQPIVPATLAPAEILPAFDRRPTSLPNNRGFPTNARP